MMLFVQLLPFFFAAGCILASFLLKPIKARGIRKPVYAQGVIVSMVRQQVQRNRTVLEVIAPVVQFETAEGTQTLHSQRFYPEWQLNHRVGDHITICYDAAHPSQFRICDVNPWYRTMLVVVGVMTMLAYAVLWMQYII